jgi:hypothetical protein
VVAVGGWTARCGADGTALHDHCALRVHGGKGGRDELESENRVAQ